MRLVWTIFPLVLFSVVGMQESQAKECYEFGSLFEDNTGRVALKATVLSSDVVVLDPPLQAYNDEEFSSKIVSEFKVDNQLYGELVFDLEKVVIDEYFQSEPYKIGEQKVVTQFYAEVEDFEQKWWPFDCYPVYDMEYEDYTNWIIGLEKDSSFEYDTEKHSFENYLETISGIESEHMKEVFGPKSPLQQIKFGTAPSDVECKSGMYLVLNNYDGRAACASTSGADKLEALGWGTRV